MNNWEAAWQETQDELNALNAELRPLQDIKDIKEREEAIKPLRAKFVDLHYRRMNLVDELRKQLTK